MIFWGFFKNQKICNVAFINSAASLLTSDDHGITSMFLSAFDTLAKSYAYNIPCRLFQLNDEKIGHADTHDNGIETTIIFESFLSTELQ